MKIESGISLKPPTPEVKAAQQDAGLKQAAKMYETYFLNEMVKAMRSTVHHDDGIVKQNMAEKIFTEQLDQQYAGNWAKKGGIGLADMIYTQIRDQYFGGTPKQIPGQHMLPIAPKTTPFGIPPSDSIQMKMLPAQNGSKLGYRFEVQSPSGGLFEARAPMAGTVTQVTQLDHGWNTVRLDHGQGLSSEMTFPGHAGDVETGEQVNAGQKLGILDPQRPVLAWNLDWV